MAPPDSSPLSRPAHVPDRPGITTADVYMSDEYPETRSRRSEGIAQTRLRRPTSRARRQTPGSPGRPQRPETRYQGRECMSYMPACGGGARQQAKSETGQAGGGLEDVPPYLDDRALSRRAFFSSPSRGVRNVRERSVSRARHVPDVHPSGSRGPGTSDPSDRPYLALTVFP